jgi:hypothetical protein
MLRKLLHERTWAKAFELSGLPVMRRHKNRIRLRIGNDGTVGTETENSDSDESDGVSCTETDVASSSKMYRQDALDNSSPRAVSTDSSWGSENFGYVRCFDNTSDLHLDAKQPVIRGDCTKNIFRNLPQLSDNNNIQGTFNEHTDKLQILKQYSESTENSSFEMRPYMACENLTNIDQNIQIESLYNQDTDFLPTRRSVPNCRAKMDTVPKLWKSTEENYSREEVDYDDDSVTNLLQHLAPPSSPKQFRDRNTIDSIIIDPPPMFRNIEEDMKVINLNINLPFRKHSLNSDKRIRRSLSKSMVETESFNKTDESRIQRMSSQSENDKISKKCECCNRSLFPSPRSSDSGVVGSCNLASPELNMHEYSTSGHNENDSDSQEKKSSRGSLTNLQEERYDNNRKKLTLSEIEAAAFEDQCRCTSPFGSTARTSCVTSVTSENSVDVMDTSHTNLTSTFTTNPPVISPQIKRTSIRRNIDKYVPEIKRVKPEPPPRIYRKPSTHLEIPKNVRQHVPCQWGTLNITERTKPSLHYHMRIYKENPETNRQSRANAPRNRDLFDKDKAGRQSVYSDSRKTRSRSEDLSKLQKGLSESSSGFVVYRSDLYAHWWMKAKLPITVVNDSGKDYFVKRYCFVYHWFEDSYCLGLITARLILSLVPPVLQSFT